MPLFGHTPIPKLQQRLRNAIKDFNDNMSHYGSKPEWQFAASMAWHAGKCMKLAKSLYSHPGVTTLDSSRLSEMLEANSSGNYQEVVMLAECLLDALERT